MRPRLQRLLSPGAALLCACQALWGGEGVDNAQNCVVHPALCAASSGCDPLTERCRPAGAPPTTRWARRVTAAAGVFSAVAGPFGKAGVDLIAAQTGSSLLRWYSDFGRSDAAAIGLQTDSELSDVQAADLDGDGTLDLVVAHPAQDSVEVLLNRGAGFARRTFRFGLRGPVRTAIGDLSGDGRADLLVVSDSEQQAQVWTGVGTTGDAAFISPRAIWDGPVRAVRIADWNGDGKADVALCPPGLAEAALLLGLGGGAFRTPAAPAPAGTDPVVAAVLDYDGDRRPELVTTRFLARTDAGLVRLDRGVTGVPERAAELAVDPRPSALASADFDRDGRADLAVGYAVLAWIDVYLNDGQGGFVRAAPIPTAGPTQALLAADFDGNGRPDLLAAQPGGVTLLVNPGGDLR